MAYYVVTEDELGAIADAIREKGGTSENLIFPANFVEAIANMTLSEAEPEEPPAPYVVTAAYSAISAGALTASGGTSSSGNAIVRSANVELDPDYIYTLICTRYTKQNPSSGTVTLTTSMTTHYMVILHDGETWHRVSGIQAPTWCPSTMDGNVLTVKLSAAYGYYIKSVLTRVARIRGTDDE